jgi:peroxiredoxin
MSILNAVNELLEHMRNVQVDVIKLSSDSLSNMSGFIEKNGLEVDEEILTSFQYQDIITQQLTANIETIESLKKGILDFEINKDTQILQEKFDVILQEAKEKKERFSGKTVEQDVSTETIEFF